MHAGDTNVALATCADGFGNFVQRALQIQNTDADAEHVDAVLHLRFRIYDLRFESSRSGDIVNRKSQITNEIARFRTHAAAAPRPELCR